MARKPTYEELEQRVKELEREATTHKQSEESLKKYREELKKMVEENRGCEDIMMQISSIESAIHKVGIIILEDHLATCFVNDVKQGNEIESLQKLRSVIEKFL